MSSSARNARDHRPRSPVVHTWFRRAVLPQARRRPAQPAPTSTWRSRPASPSAPRPRVAGAKLDLVHRDRLRRLRVLAPAARRPRARAASPAAPATGTGESSPRARSEGSREAWPARVQREDPLPQARPARGSRAWRPLTPGRPPRARRPRGTTGRIWSSSRSVCTEYGAGNGCPAAAGSRVAAQISIETGSRPSLPRRSSGEQVRLPRARSRARGSRVSPAARNSRVQLELLPRHVKEPAKVDVVRSGAQRAPHDASRLSR